MVVRVYPLGVTGVWSLHDHTCHIVSQVRGKLVPMVTVYDVHAEVKGKGQVHSRQSHESGQFRDVASHSFQQ